MCVCGVYCTTLTASPQPGLNVALIKFSLDELPLVCEKFYRIFILMYILQIE